MNKKIIATILAGCLLLCGMTGCGEKTEETVPVQTAEAAETTAHLSAYMDEQTAADAEAYASVLEHYHQALTENWSMAQYAEAGLSYMATYCADKSSVFFSFYDLDADGDRELLIGSAVNDEVVDRQVFEAYDLIDGTPRQLFCGFERIRYYLCDVDGEYWIVREGSGGAAISYWHYARYDGNGLVLQDGIIFNADSSPDAPWFRTEDWEGETCVSIDAETAEEIIAAYDAKKANIYRGFTCIYTFDDLD